MQKLRLALKKKKKKSNFFFILGGYGFLKYL